MEAVPVHHVYKFGPTEDKPQDRESVCVSQTWSNHSDQGERGSQERCGANAGGGKDGQQRSLVGDISVDLGIEGVVRMKRGCGVHSDGQIDGSRQFTVLVAVL